MATTVSLYTYVYPDELKQLWILRWILRRYNP